jgi:hypothetical protein
MRSREAHASRDPAAWASGYDAASAAGRSARRYSTS